MAVKNDTAYIVADRTIGLPLNIDTFGVLGDANAKVVEFRTSRFSDGVDLSEKTIYICYKNAFDDTGETPCTDIKLTNTALTFHWIVPPEVAAATGNIEFYVEFRTIDSDGNKIYCMKTKPITRYIEDSFYIYNNASEADYSIIDSWIQNNGDRIDRDDLMDTDLPFKVKDRDILFHPDKIVAVKDDNLSQALTFRLKRTVDNIDRSNMAFAFAFLNENGETGIAPACNIMHTEDEIFISWALESTATKVSGEVHFFIFVAGTLSDGKRYLWNTKPASLVVESTLEIDNNLEIPTEKWYETLLLEVDNAVKQASNYANKAKEAYNSTSTIQTIADQTLADCKEAELNAQKFAVEAKEAFSALNDISITREDKDSNGIFKTVKYIRQDGSLHMKTALLGEMTDTAKYTGLLVEIYGSDGTTLIFTKNYSIIYDDDGDVMGQLTILNYLSYHTTKFFNNEAV